MAWMSFLYGKDKIKGYVACFFKKSGISEGYGAVYKQHRRLRSFVYETCTSCQHQALV